MKVFISSDMEGTAGVVDWSQCRPGEPEYGYYRSLLLEEVNAAIEGAQAGGATEFLVNDSHSTMRNLRPDQLAGNARYLSGRHKPAYMMEGLDSSFDAVFFVSYHGSMATGSPLSHTYNPLAIAKVELNGTEVGESGINALVAAGLGVPVALVTGDDVTAAEAEAVCPGIATAVVKRAVSRFSAESLHPFEARSLIRDAARRAVESLPAPPPIRLPATLDVTFRNADLAAMATWITGVERTGGVTVRLGDDDPVALFRRFITIVILTRGIAE